MLSRQGHGGAGSRAWWRTARLPRRRTSATKSIEIAKRVANHLIATSTPADAPYPHFPLTYTNDPNQPRPQARERAGKWMFVPAAVDTALGYLDLFDATKDQKYFDAAKAIADTYRKTQGEDSTWSIMVDLKTGEPIRPNRQIPTWIIFFYDRLETQYGVADYKESRKRAWNWIVEHPLKTYQWDGQFEDGRPGEPYKNLAREQACDVAGMLLDDAKNHPENVAQAEELIRFSEDQFVVWATIKDPAGWAKVMPNRRPRVGQWITPSVCEQYGAYAPVARSSAILINTYLKAYKVTGKELYVERARALANGLIKGQAWLAETHDGNGEIPTWLTRGAPMNWLNNSFYAAEAVKAVANLTDPASAAAK